MSVDVTQNPDEGSLRLLSIFFYILACMSGLAGCIVMSFALLGIAVMAGAVEGLPREIAMFLGLILVVLESIIAIIVWGLGLLETLTARSFATRSRYRFCCVMACLELLNVPFGTAVGIFAIVILSRPSVRALYDGNADRRRRLAALDALDDDEPAPPHRADDDDGAIQERLPNP